MIRIVIKLEEWIVSNYLRSDKYYTRRVRLINIYNIKNLSDVRTRLRLLKKIS